MATLYRNFLAGTITDSPLTDVATTVNSANFANLPVVSSDIMWLVLDPDADAGAPEIVKITAHSSSATSVTVEREQQSTTAREHLVGTTWRIALTQTDVEEFLKAVVTDDIGDDQVTGAKIADDSIDSNHYVDGSIDLAHLATDSVDGTKIANDSIDGGHIVDGSIDAVNLASNSVTTDKIAAANVTLAKIAAEAWTTHNATVTQSGTVSRTVTYSKYVQIGKTVHWVFRFDITGTGAFAAITLNLPVTAANVNGLFGEGKIYNASSAGWTEGPWDGVSTTSIQWNEGAGGIDLASGDALVGSITYEAA